MEKTGERGKKRVLHREITNGEIITCSCILFLLVIIIIWLSAQRNEYVPEERDITFEMLKSSSKGIDLYKPAVIRLSKAVDKQAVEEESLPHKTRRKSGRKPRRN